MIDKENIKDYFIKLGFEEKDGYLYYYEPDKYWNGNDLNHKIFIYDEYFQYISVYNDGEFLRNKRYYYKDCFYDENNNLCHKSITTFYK